MLLVGALGLGAGTIVVSIERTTMPLEERRETLEGFREAEALLAGFAGGNEFRFAVEDEAIRFYFDFEAGWDDYFYEQWEELYLDVLNGDLGGGSDPGLMWERVPDNDEYH